MHFLDAAFIIFSTPYILNNYSYGVNSPAVFNYWISVNLHNNDNSIDKIVSKNSVILLSFFLPYLLLHITF